MSPFEFVLLFISFVYALSLTHLLMGWARMVRRRRDLVFSAPHALWTVVAFATVIVNWLGFWDFHTVPTIDLPTFAGAVILCVANYLVAALVTPEFEKSEGDDLAKFHATQGPTYLGALLVLVVIAIILNTAAQIEGITKWGAENSLVVAMAGPIVAALASRRRLVQFLAPAIEIVLFITFAVLYYPRIA